MALGMSPGALLLIIFFVLIFLRVPIAVSLGVAAMSVILSLIHI